MGTTAAVAVGASLVPNTVTTRLAELERVPSVMEMVCVPTVATVDVGAPVNIVFADAAQGAAKVESLLTDTALWTQASADSLAYFERNHSSTEVLARYARLLEELG